jgi:hypothetical protein
MAAQTPDQAVAAHSAGQPTAAESYATKMLAEQDRLGVPPDEQHVISKITAPQMVQQITADPERAPAAIKTLQATWGSAWPEVWKDLTTVGKLPAAYQMVGALDNEGDGALLARALGQANKEGVNKPLDDLIDRGATGATRPSQVVRTRVEGSDAVKDYRSSMLASGASLEQVDGIVSSIGLLGQAKVLYHNEDATAAGDEAVQSALGQWDFLPNGGARIPRANADAITDNAQRTVAGLSLAAVRPPAIYGGGVGRQNVEDIFTPEQNLARNEAWTKPGVTNFQTELSPPQEQQFRHWVTTNHIPFDPNEKTSDYDMRGFWQAQQAGDPQARTAVDPNDNPPHFPDTWKTPYAATFSAQSRYADPAKAPDWKGDQYTLPGGQVLYDDKAGRWLGAQPNASPGAATADDWMRVLQAAPNWITVGQSIRLMDNGGRFVRAANGGFVEVPFNVTAPPATTAGTASPPVNVPPY